MNCRSTLQLLILTLLLPIFSISQNTTSSISGTVKAADGTPLPGTTVTATHEPTGTVYRVQTLSGGRFDISNMNTGGPYNIEVTYVNYQTEKRTELYLSLGEVLKLNLVLASKGATLTEVVVTTQARATEVKGGAGTNIGRDKMANLPTVGRNLSDFLRFTPQVKLTAADGGISIAGQNNRYNAFYIDGAINNDVFGLSNSGTNGGQASSPPISIDAIDQFQVIISPYDASIGNFTGGGINATTRSGSNTTTGSLYYFYRNQDLAAKTPIGLKKDATRLNTFRNKTTGFRIGGPIIKNKVFYFLNAEIQRDQRPQPFVFSQYRGSSTEKELNDFAGLLKQKYNYDPGGFLDNPESIDADKITAKIDWNINTRNRLSVSYRYNNAERLNTSTSSGTNINYFNNGFTFPSKTHSVSTELKSTFNGGRSNRLLMTYTGVVDDRGAIGNPFPRVSIIDGAGRIVIGTENFSGANLLKQNNVALLDFYKFNLGKNFFTIGTDNEFSHSYNVFIRDNYGTYTYNSLFDFISDAAPVRYQRSFSLVDKTSGDNTDAAAKFNTMRLGGFFNNEIRVNENFSINAGVRVDYTKFLTTPKKDQFFNDSALPAISRYYDLQGARSGQIASPKASISPRLGFTLKVPEENVTIRGGFGLFTGRVPLVWPGGVYNQNGVSIGGIDLNPPTAQQNVTFRPDPFGQYTAQELGLGLNNKGQVDMIVKDFRLPKIFRTSAAIDKKMGNGWTTSFETIISKNINEIYYQNVNILPPTLKMTGPDTRNIYAVSGTVKRIPIRSNGTNPYNADVFLLSNNQSQKGFSYNFTFTVDKAWSKGFAFNANYTYGNSVVTNEGTSSQNNSQWNTMESVNGRNFIPRSTSDFDLGHRINAYVAKKVNYLGKRFGTTFSLVYNGQSGNPFSYTYRNSPVNDVTATGTSDLIFVPTEAQLNDMVFNSNTVGPKTYTAAEQKALLNDYINNDNYLKNRRGQYAERNGARLPFTNIIDLKIQQDFNLKLGAKTYQLQLSYDVFNFTNMLNRDWGRQYFLSFDQYALIQFGGYRAGTTVPTYRFTPIPDNAPPYNISTSTVPSYSARYISQLGVRLNF
ncbi:MAG: TonB-dependent receptor [Chitinophagaceae bacterium]|nr:TonB-dependent receptor [Chitinophagaceae bacterium]